MLKDARSARLPGYLVLAALACWTGACDGDSDGDSASMSPAGAAVTGGTSGAAGATGGASPAGAGASTGDAGMTTGAPGSTLGGTSGRDAGAPGVGMAGPGGTRGGSVGDAGTTTAEAGSPGGSARADSGAGAPDADGSAGTGSDAGPGACPHVQLKGSDICTIGDSWIQIPGNQVTTLENHMKMAGVIPQADRFDRREVSGSTLSAIIRTYERKPMNCKILIMDGGGIDLFVARAGDQAAIAPIVQMFKDFLQKLKSDGYVQHVVYSLYPVIPSTPNLNVNMKPGFSEACAASAVDCHLVDLEPLFKGQHIGSDQTHADQAGGVIIGDAWWKAMKENCVAQ